MRDCEAKKAARVAAHTGCGLFARGRLALAAWGLAALLIVGPVALSACGGCEFGYGNALGADTAAWIVVQKVSDLILNINVYMADVAARKLAFVHSVDIRGNTDESWSHGITYLVKNYLLPAP
jgi:hypothetical protein